MNQKELNELRRRFRPERSGIAHVYGCFVNGMREVVAETDVSLGMSGKEEQEMYLTLLRKTLSGSLGRNLIDIPFETKQVAGSDEHRLLQTLRESACADENARHELYSRVISSLDMQGENYLILLAGDAYDVPHRGADGEKDELSDEVFRFFVCTVCPVKDATAALRYFSEERAFHGTSTGQTVAAPALGFLFPAFDDRRANIYDALYYSHDTAEIHPELIDGLFRVAPPMSAAEQKETFSETLAAALDTDCRFDVVQAVHENLRSRIEEHKEAKDPDALEITARDVVSVLRTSGVPLEKTENSSANAKSATVRTPRSTRTTSLRAKARDRNAGGEDHAAGRVWVSRRDARDRRAEIHPHSRRRRRGGKRHRRESRRCEKE